MKFLQIFIVKKTSLYLFDKFNSIAERELVIPFVLSDNVHFVFKLFVLMSDSQLYYCVLQSCQNDLIKDSGHKYFLSVLSDQYMPVCCILSCR